MNWLSYVILVIIATAFLAIIIKGISNKRKGKSSCSCGCSGCAMKDSCHAGKASNK